MGMRVDIVTLFPEMCQQVLDASIIGRAARRGYIETHCHQIRDYTLNKQKQTDDYPYGGGCGMVLYAQPIADCLRAVQKEVAEQGRPAPHIVFLTAGGQRYTEGAPSPLRLPHPSLRRRPEPPLPMPARPLPGPLPGPRCVRRNAVPPDPPFSLP